MRVAVRDIVGEYAVTPQDGQRVYGLIAHELANGQPVALDFEGVTALLAPFCNAAVGQLLKDYTPDDVKRLLRVEHLVPAGREVLRQVLRDAAEYYSSPAHREAHDEVLRATAEDV